MFRNLSILILAHVLLAACAQLDSPLIPTSEIWQVQFSPATAHFGPFLNRCTSKLDSVALLSFEIPAPDLSLQEADFALRWGPPPLENSAASVIKEDRLVIIVHPDNPIQSLDLNQLMNIYSNNAAKETGEVSAWAIQPWAYPDGSDVGTSFLSYLSTPRLMNPSIKIAPDPAALSQIISQQTNAIGPIPESWVTDSVRIIPILGLPDGRDRFPILLMTKPPISSPQMKWIKCLQDSHGF
jgi:DNA-binding transcriptional LysR family regulator